MENGKFIISLDFELMWGVRDKKTISSYGKNIKNTHDVIDFLLESFEKFKVNATFSIVGFLFSENKKELIAYSPKVKPVYKDLNLSPFNGYIDTIGENFQDDKYHYAIDSIRKIKSSHNHEISTHTFSHYYCLEEGQSKESFNQDIVSAVAIAKKEGVKISSIIFPRNQYNSSYDDVLLENNINIIRSNEKSWFYNPKKGNDDTSLRRVMRLIDAYFNISGHNSFLIEETDKIISIPSSRFLRPYSHRFRFFEKIRLRRILNSMTYAAKNNEIFHLWWHPHNFGANFNENKFFLEAILKHYLFLNKKYNFVSYTMKGSCEKKKN